MKTLTSKEQKRTFLITDIIFIIIFICSLLFLLWKCRFGFGNIDESLYLAIPWRVIQGDALFVKEWHVSQMSSVLVLPFLKAYLLCGGTAEGIILAFRYIYTAVQAAASIFIYFRLRKYSCTGAAASSLFFMIYAPYGIMAMSYNSLGILNLALSIVILFSAKQALRLQQAVSGAFFAAAVLCSPYLLILYVVYILAAAAAALRRRNKHREADLRSAFTFRSWVFFTAGAAVVAVLFAAFLLSRASVRDIIAALPGIMNDPEHVSIGIFTVIKDYLRSVLLANRFSLYIYIAFAVLFIVMLIDRRRHLRRVFYMCAAGCLALALMASFMLTFRYLNFIMFPLNAMAPFCLVLFRDDEEIRKLFTTIWIPGMIYTFCIHMSSNQQFYVISSASGVALIASVLMTARCADTMRNDARETEQGSCSSVKAGIVLPVVLVICLFGSQLVCETFMRYKAVFWEDMSIVTERIEKGPSKGLFACKENADVYNDFTESTEMIRKEYPEADSILLFSEKTWGYLVLSDLKNASSATWLSIIGHADETMERLKSYYGLNPDKIPDLIYLEPEYADYESSFGDISDYKSAPLSNGATLLIRQ